MSVVVLCVCVCVCVCGHAMRGEAKAIYCTGMYPGSGRHLTIATPAVNVLPLVSAGYVDVAVVYVGGGEVT